MQGETELKNQFARELMEWSRSGKLPKSADQDVRCFLELQQERIRQRGLKMELELEAPKEEESVSGGRRTRTSKRSRKYESFINFTNCTRKLRFYRDGKKVFSGKWPETLYVTTTYLKEKEMTGAEKYCCPSCGAISTVRELQTGCPYCQTHFVMSELFPKVTDFYYLHELTDRANVLWNVKTITTVFALIGAIWGLVQIAEVSLFERIITAIIGGAMCALFGYMLCSVSLMVGLFKEAGKSVAPLVHQAETKKKIIALLSGFDPSFSWDYFVNQLISTTKAVLFAQDRSNLVMYEGADPHPELDTIIESAYEGDIRLVNYRVQDGYCWITFIIRLLDIHDNGQRIFQRHDRFSVTIVKNVMQMEEVGFSIRRAECRSCGGSFDATRVRVCPFCGKPYDMKDDGWVITDIYNIRDKRKHKTR